MCVCVLLLVIFLLLFFSTRVCCLFLLFCWKLRMPSLIFCFVVFFSFFLRFVSSFEQSNGNCMNFYFFCLLVYCLKSGKCIIISVCLFSQNLDPLPSLFLLRPSPFTKFAFSLAISFSVLSRSKLDTQKWIFSRFFKVQIRLDSFVQKLWIIVWESSSICFVVVVGSTSLVVLDVVALRFSANAAAACVLVCVSW